MSEIFSYHPEGGETLEAFNARIAQFCSDNATVDLDASSFLDEGLALSLVEAEDLQFMLTRALQPVVMLLDKKQAITLERVVGDYQKRLMESRQDSAIIRTKVVSLSKVVYVIILLHVYDLEIPADAPAEAGSAE